MIDKQHCCGVDGIAQRAGSQGSDVGREDGNSWSQYIQGTANTNNHGDNQPRDEVHHEQGFHREALSGGVLKM
jgi:hypothetical protein